MPSAAMAFKAFLNSNQVYLTAKESSRAANYLFHI